MEIMVILPKLRDVYVAAAIIGQLRKTPALVREDLCVVHGASYTVTITHMDYIAKGDITHGRSIDAAVTVGKVPPEVTSFVGAVTLGTPEPIILNL